MPARGDDEPVFDELGFYTLAGQAESSRDLLEDVAGVLRRLFRGEVIVGHDGPAGRWPVLHLSSSLDEHLPLGMVAFGPDTLRLAGRGFDEVVLHTEAIRGQLDIGCDAVILHGASPTELAPIVGAYGSSG